MYTYYIICYNTNMDYGYIFAHLTIILTLAATSGILTGKLKQPIMIGYIIAGVLVGPSCFGLVASQEQVHFYSELGILLLLFVIGMELNIKSFLKMWKIPTLFTVIQVVGSALLAVLLSHVFGFSVYVSLLTAFFTCLSSTAAIVKVLEYLGESKTDVGHITIGILVAQDIVVVPMMLIIKECGKPLGISIVLELAFAIGLVVFMLKYLGKKEQIRLPVNHIVPNQELVPVVTLAAVFISATVVTFFGLSEAYGAFLAGLFIGNTQARQNVLNSIKPIQNVLLMVFFLSVGLMFDMKFLFQNWFIVLLSLILVTSWKIFFNSVILRMFSIELAKATSIGIILAQLGEFSLVLATVATQSGIIGIYGQKLIVCITALSLSISPLFITLSKKTRNLSFTGDNSANSIIKVIFSGRFSKLVEILIHRFKNTIKNKIEKIKAHKEQAKEAVIAGIYSNTKDNDNISEETNSNTRNELNTKETDNITNNKSDIEKINSNTSDELNMKGMDSSTSNKSDTEEINNDINNDTSSELKTTWTYSSTSNEKGESNNINICEINIEEINNNVEKDSNTDNIKLNNSITKNSDVNINNQCLDDRIKASEKINEKKDYIDKTDVNNKNNNNVLLIADSNKGSSQLSNKLDNENVEYVISNSNESANINIVDNEDDNVENITGNNNGINNVESVSIKVDSKGNIVESNNEVRNNSEVINNKSDEIIEPDNKKRTKKLRRLFKSKDKK